MRTIQVLFRIWFAKGGTKNYLCRILGC